MVDIKEKPLLKASDIEDALEATGHGKFNFLLILTCGLILYAVNSDSYSVGYILPAAECDLDLSVQDKSVLTAIGFIGIMSTQFFWGFLSDSRGRKHVLLYTLSASFICTLASTFAPYLWLFIVFRFLNGAFISCASATVFAYLGEFMCNRHRSSSITTSCIFVGLALTIIPATAWLILPLNFNIEIAGFNFLPWRLHVLLCAVPTLFACFALFFFPESPKYLLQSGNIDASLEVLKTVFAFNTNKHRDDFGINWLQCEQEKKVQGNIMVEFVKQTCACFKPRYLKNTILVCVLQFGIFATSSGVLFWYPDILRQLSSSGSNLTVCQAFGLAKAAAETEACTGDIDSAVFLQNIYIGIAYTIGFAVVSFLINIIGIKAILFLFLSFASLCTGTLFWVTNQLLIDSLFMCILVITGLCVSVVSAAVIDLFPTHLRAMAVCLCMFNGRLGSVVSSSVFGYLLEWNCNATFFIYSAKLLGISLLALLLPSRKK